MSDIRSCWHVLAAVLVSLSLLACNNDDKKAASQVAAKVNKDEISVHQVNAVLARAGAANLPPEQIKAASKQALERLIDQQLLAQQALEQKLDRDPRIMQALEAARQEILSRAYLEKVVGGAAKPEPAEIKSYYDHNPALFAQRRLYNFTQVLVPVTDQATAARLQEIMGKAKNAADLTAALKKEGIKFAAGNVSRSAEQLPLELLPRFHAMKDGQAGVIPAPNSLMYVYLVSSKAQPVNETTAAPLIEKFLANKARQEAAERELKQLRGKAKIEYVGDFSSVGEEKSAAEAKAKAEEKTTAEEKAKSEAKTKADERAAAEEQSLAEAKARAEAKAKLDEQLKAEQKDQAGKNGAAVDAAVIQKGVSGLK